MGRSNGVASVTLRESVKDPYVIGRNDNVISINAFLEAGLDSEVNAEAVQGRRCIAPGPRGAFASGARVGRPVGGVAAGAYRIAGALFTRRCLIRAGLPATANSGSFSRRML